MPDVTSSGPVSTNSFIRQPFIEYQVVIKMKPLPSEALKSSTLANVFYVNRLVKELQNVINAIKEINRLVRKRILRNKREETYTEYGSHGIFPK